METKGLAAPLANNTTVLILTEQTLVLQLVISAPHDEAKSVIPLHASVHWEMGARPENGSSWRTWRSRIILASGRPKAAEAC